MRRLKTILTLADRTNGIALIDGPYGVGKTTAVAACARSLETACAYVNMVGITGRRHEIADVWTALTGTTASGTSAEIREQVMDFLRDERVILIIDDAHNVTRDSLATLLWIWNKLHKDRGHGTPMVLCGNSLAAHLESRRPELLSRKNLTFEMPALSGPEVVTSVLVMEPAIAGTDPDLLRSLNRWQFHGNLRRWTQFLDLIMVIRGGSHVAPLNQEEADAVMAVMGSGR